jgi:hypothetical protein
MPKTASTFTLLLLCLSAVIAGSGFADAQYSGTVCINSDGSVTGTSSIQRQVSHYILTGNITGGISVQKSNIVLDGNGFAIIGSGEGWGIDLSNGRSQNPARPEISNVTIANLTVTDFYYGINNANTNSNTFEGNHIIDCVSSLWIIGSSNNTILNNTFERAGITINYAGFSVITGNDFINCSIQVWLSQLPDLNMNYWSDYNERYPSAKETGTSGIWNTPYVIGDNCSDTQPRIHPMADSLSSNMENSTDPSQTSPLIQNYIAISIAAVAVILAAVFLAHKKRRIRCE